MQPWLLDYVTRYVILHSYWVLRLFEGLSFWLYLRYSGGSSHKAWV